MKVTTPPIIDVFECDKFSEALRVVDIDSVEFKESRAEFDHKKRVREHEARVIG